jgi:hypothetical protein
VIFLFSYCLLVIDNVLLNVVFLELDTEYRYCVYGSTPRS